MGVWRKIIDKTRDTSPRFFVNDDLAWLFLDHIEPSVFMDQWYVQPFNGQALRWDLIARLASEFQPTHVVETGTYLGSTTPYLASLASGPTVTIEIDSHVAARAKRRFQRNHASMDIDLVLGDSATTITRVLSRWNPDTTRLLAYLDAHWRDQIPTAAELTALDAWGGPWLAVIDDFRVPDDAGYGYDSYGAVVIGPEVVPDLADVQIWVPAAPAARESGARRGTGFVMNDRALTFLPNREIAGLRRVR